MKDILPNFSRAEDALEAAESFCRRAAVLCEANAGRAHQPRAQQFLQYAAKTTHCVAEDLGSQCKQSGSDAMKTFVQYTPVEPVPGDPELAELANRGVNEDVTFEQLQQASRRWGEVFEQLEAASTVPEAQELHAGCRELFQTWGKDLTTTFMQGMDA